AAIVIIAVQGKTRANGKPPCIPKEGMTDAAIYPSWHVARVCPAHGGCARASLSDASGFGCRIHRCRNRIGLAGAYLCREALGGLSSNNCRREPARQRRPRCRRRNRKKRARRVYAWRVHQRRDGDPADIA